MVNADIIKCDSGTKNKLKIISLIKLTAKSMIFLIVTLKKLNVNEGNKNVVAVPKTKKEICKTNKKLKKALTINTIKVNMNSQMYKKCLKYKVKRHLIFWQKMVAVPKLK